MKKIILLAFTSVLSFNLFSAEQPVSDANQKWLGAVEKMVASGRHQISTPVEARTLLLKDWAKKNGYTFQLTKTESTFRVELSKNVREKLILRPARRRPENFGQVNKRSCFLPP